MKKERNTKDPKRVYAIQAFIPANILLIASATMILLTVYTMK